MTTFSIDKYTPAGPTVSRFHASSQFHRYMAGPIGSGKTTALGPIECSLLAVQQRPDADGHRRASVGILRDTYRNLYATTMETWKKVFPTTLGHFTGSDDRPARHQFSFPAPYFNDRGEPTGQVGLCHLDAQFRALGAQSVENVCRGWELMGAFIDEEDLVPENARAFLAGRVMRGGDVRYRVSRGVWGAFNKPDVDHPLYELEEDGHPGFFDQPGGILPGGPPYLTNPKAENLAQLDANYYQRSAEDQKEWYIRRMLRNLWGASVAGDPIYLWDPDRHVCHTELEPNDGDELVLGLDGGGTPAAVIVGRTPTGRRICYAEVVLVDPSDRKGRRLATGVGAKRFAEAIRDVLYPRFRHCRIRLGYGDPAAFYGADREMGEYSFMETVGNKLEIPIMNAPSNEITLRLDAVRELKDTNNRHDGQPNLMINPSCKFVRRGFASDYKWEEKDPKQPGKTLKPQKSATSHVHDALQYVCLGDQGRAAVVSGARFDRHRAAAVPQDADPGFAQASQHIWREHQARVAKAGDGASYRGGDFDVWGS